MVDRGSSPSSPAGPRLWRPAAQRQVRNSWSSIAAQLTAWSSVSAQGLSAATSAVNAILSHEYVDLMDLGVLETMQGIRGKAKDKHVRQAEGFCKELLIIYDRLIECIWLMLRAKESMRTYVKGSAKGPLIEFSSKQYLSKDVGDGDGLPVFSILSLSTHEMLAEELINMLSSELWIKFLIVFEIHYALNTILKIGNPKEQALEVLHKDFLQSKLKIPLFAQEKEGALEAFSKYQSFSVRREVLQVNLTAWLAEVNIRRSRVEEILKIVSEEIRLNLQ